MERVRLPKPIRLAQASYADPENLFHITINEALGKSALVHPEVRAAVWELIVDELAGSRARFVAACLMPDHLHLLVGAGAVPVDRWVHSFKSLSTRRSWVAGAKGSLWQPSYYDQRIRDEEAFWAVLRYVVANPVEAGLVSRPGEWRWLYVDEQYREIVDGRDGP